MKTLKPIVISVIVFVVIATVIYMLGVKYDPQNYNYAPVALSCMYSSFMTLVAVGGYYFAKEIVD